jgi:hypothetical protein
MADWNLQFHKWWERFQEEHEEWKMADSNALRYAAYEAGRNDAIKESAWACKEYAVIKQSRDANHCVKRILDLMDCEQSGANMPAKEN